MTDGPQAIHGHKKPDLPKGTMVVSPTQYETADLCNRKWWFLKVLKLPVVQKDFFTFGNVLHRSAELYLRATLQGAVPLPSPGWTTDGQGRYQAGPFEGQRVGDPVDLHPRGWDAEISSGEASLIKRLIQTGIDEGILCRQPLGLVEQQWWFPVLDEVWITGIIDFAYKWQVEDHKTTKAFRWAKSPAELAKAAPMLLYAKALVEYFKYEYDGEPIILRHNVFQKDPSDPRVRKTETEIQYGEIEDFWNNRLVPAAENMLYLRDNAEEWTEVPEPRPGSNACTAYGGCPFQAICSGICSVDDYKERTQRIIDNPKNVKEKRALTFSDLPKGSGTMGLLEDRLNAVKEKNKQQEAQEAYPKPPWANSGCSVPSCKGKGWNQKGNPCGICEQMTDGVPVGLYQIDYQDGYVILFLEGEELGRFLGPAQAPIKVEDRTAPPAAAKAPVEPQESEGVEGPHPTPPPPEAVTEPESVSVPVVSEEEIEEVEAPAVDPPKKKRGRPRKAFTLAINCAPVRGTSAIKHLDQVFRDMAQALAEAHEKESYFQLNAFQRRDQLAQRASEIAESLGKDIYLVCPDSPDMKAFVDALRPYASAVWEPFAGTTTIVVEGQNE